MSAVVDVFKNGSHYTLNLPSARRYLSGTTFQSLAIFAGGQEFSGGSFTQTNKVSIFQLSNTGRIEFMKEETMPNPRSFFSVSAVKQFTIFAGGQQDGTTILDRVTMRFENGSYVDSRLSLIPAAACCSFLSSAVMEDIVVLGGGFTYVGQSGTILGWNTSSVVPEWISYGSLSQARGEMSALSVCGWVIFAGGRNLEVFSRTDVFDNVDIIDLHEFYRGTCAFVPEVTTQSLEFPLTTEEPLDIAPSESQRRSNFVSLLFAIGLGVGLILACVLCLIFIIILFSRARKRNSRRSYEFKNHEEMLSPEEQERRDKEEGATSYLPMPLQTTDSADTPSHLSSLILNTSDSLQWEINFSEIQLIKEIGHGAFGKVFQASWRSTPVAVKQLNTEAIGTNKVEEFLNEISLMKKLRPHANVVALFGISTSPPAIITFAFFFLFFSNLRKISIFFFLKVNIVAEAAWKSY